jgi:hypothetical protein
MDEWQRLTHQHQVDKQWGELLDKLKTVWSDAYESRAYYAKRVLDQAGPELLAKLAALPLATQVQIAEGFARAGSGVGMSVEDSLFAAQLIAEPQSRYRGPRSNDPEERELHETARELVDEFYGSMPDGNQPADPSEPPPPVGAEPSPEAQAEARKLMDTKGPFFNKAHPDHAAVRAKVQALLSGTSAPPTPGAMRPQGPARNPEAEARELMQGEAYRHAGHPESQAVRAQVSALFSEAYPEPSPTRGEGGDAHE